jgi:hypothetical protein
MNWGNVCRIDWCGIIDSKHRVNYNGSKMLPGPFVGHGCIDLTPDEFTSMYQTLKAEERRGMPVAWAGDQISATVPRTIIGLDKVRDYFRRHAAKARAVMDYEDKLKMRKRIEELEDRVAVLEAYVRQTGFDTVQGSEGLLDLEES